ncbi:MAG: hypothetical protein Q9191_005011 [Dirinaria sp. TL-2023a]
MQNLKLSSPKPIQSTSQGPLSFAESKAQRRSDGAQGAERKTRKARSYDPQDPIRLDKQMGREYRSQREGKIGEERKRSEAAGKSRSFKEIVGNQKDKSYKIEAAVREKLDSQRSEWATDFYIGKMRDTLKGAESEVVEKEMKEMREALRHVFKEKAKTTQKEVHRMLLDEEGG